MIRINLLGQTRPKTTGPAVPVEAWVRTFLLLGAVGLAVVILSIRYVQMKRDLDDTQRQITKALQEKARLEQVRQQVEQFGRDMSILQQRIAVIEELRRNRTGGSELLSTVANTVVRTDELWLTSLARKGTSLELQGEAGSINAVANLITQMKRSGYFDKIEITEAKENDLAKGVETFSFNLKADFKLPPGQQAQAGQPAPAAPRKS
jgi:Tfp pilus assembly protein PilN